MSGAEVSTLISESINSLSWSEKQNYKPAVDIVQSAITMTVGLIEFYLKVGLGMGPWSDNIFFSWKGLSSSSTICLPAVNRLTDCLKVVVMSENWFWRLRSGTNFPRVLSNETLIRRRKLVIVNYSRAHRIQSSTKPHLSTKSSLIIQHETWQPHIHPDF